VVLSRKSSSFSLLMKVLQPRLDFRPVRVTGDYVSKLSDSEVKIWTTASSTVFFLMLPIPIETERNYLQCFSRFLDPQPFCIPLPLPSADNNRFADSSDFTIQCVSGGCPGPHGRGFKLILTSTSGASTVLPAETHLIRRASILRIPRLLFKGDI